MVMMFLLKAFGLFVWNVKKINDLSSKMMVYQESSLPASIISVISVIFLFKFSVIFCISCWCFARMITRLYGMHACIHFEL